MGVHVRKIRIVLFPGSENERMLDEYIRIYLILVGCCGCMLDVVICGDRCGDRARCALNVSLGFVTGLTDCV